MTVKEITEKILTKACGTFRLEQTCDLLMCGSFDAEVTGIATTFIITPNVITECVNKGINFIITHEPTWFTGHDTTTWCEKDPVYLQKRKMLEENNINVWRFHDHMHMTKPDLIYVGLIKELGWEPYKVVIDKPEVAKTEPIERIGDAFLTWLYEIPETSLKTLATEFKTKLNIPTIRFIGDPNLSCKTVGILVGGGSLGLGTEEMPMQFMNNANVDVLICGDITEWTICSYVNDASQMGMKKAALILGHEKTEEAGMKHLPTWMADIIPDLPITFIEAGEPFGYF